MYNVGKTNEKIQNLNKNINITIIIPSICYLNIQLKYNPQKKLFHNP